MEQTCTTCCYFSSCKKIKELEDKEGRIYVQSLNLARDCNSYLNMITTYEEI